MRYIVKAIEIRVNKPQWQPKILVLGVLWRFLSGARGFS